MSTTTTLTTLSSDIIHTHILPRLDGPSLSATTTVSSHLHHLCSDDPLWADVTKSTWPSTTHPRVNTLISTFPSGHRSFFHDSFPALFSDTRHRSSTPPPPSTTIPPRGGPSVVRGVARATAQLLSGSVKNVFFSIFILRTPLNNN
ncbi:putative F-box-like domain superfamily protein [Helianthus debilis subsp. tardiflorus]